MEEPFIICPENMVNIKCYPIGHVIGCSTDLIEFDKKFHTSLTKSSLPITLGCSISEFYDCFLYATESAIHFSPIIVDLRGKTDDDLRAEITNKKLKLTGYINCCQSQLMRILKEFNFYDIPGIHIFHLPDAITFESNNNHFYLRPLKYRVIDAILAIHFWGKSRSEKIDYALSVQAALTTTYRDAEGLINQYLILSKKPPIQGVIVRDESYREASHKDFMENAERNYLISKINENGGNIAKTAKKIGISRNTLKKKVELYEG